jgi:hypothetical protein
MQFFQETTKYKEDIPSGIYLLNDSKSRMYAFIPAGSDTVKTFKAPITISTRGRSFKAVPNTFNYIIPGRELSKNPTWKVKGSKGDSYTVTVGSGKIHCTCSGFQFRKSCKHVKEVDYA